MVLPTNQLTNNVKARDPVGSKNIPQPSPPSGPSSGGTDSGCKDPRLQLHGEDPELPGHCVLPHLAAGQHHGERVALRTHCHCLHCG